MNELLDKLFSTSEGRCVYNAALSVIDSYGMAEKLKEGTLVGLSGGADSVMLLLVLLEYRRRVSDFQILAIHVNHMIRGEEAERDERFSEELCKSLGVEYESVRIDVPRLAQAQKTGLEEAARKARYSAFEKIISVREDIQTVAVAHNATDNLETVIFNMMRGTGLLGVCGISPVRDNVVRPLITSPKSDIVLALQSVGIEYVVDSTNLETEYSRNYIRHKIIPALSKLNSSPESMATRLSENLRADEIFISKIANTFIMENRKDGAIDVNLLRQLDKAVLRVLKLKDDLGLFDNPYRSTDVEEAEKIILCKEHRDLARYAAEESAVLLKNNGILPLKEDVSSVAVIGPLANTGEIFGNWHCGAKAEETITVLDGIKSIIGDRAKYAKGCDIEITSTDESQIAKAVKLAKKCEKVVLCLGEHQFDSGESQCKAILELPEVQYKLLNEVLKVNKNVVVLLFTGRPLAIERLDAIAPAILNMWMPGTEGGNAAANLLFARSVPSGKITMSFPRVSGQCPIYYNSYNTGRPKLQKDLVREKYTSSYLDVLNSPLYPFGYGMSYSTFEYSDKAINKTIMTRGEKIIASVKVKNTGNYKCKEIVQLYIRDLVGSIVRPVKELKGFEKIELDIGEEKTVTFEIDEESLAFYGADLTKKAENGKFQVFIGASSDCEPFAEFELK